MSDNGVADTDQECGIQEVCLHLSALSNRTSDNRGKSTSKGELEEPVLKTNVVTLEEESFVSSHGEAIVFRVVTAVSESIADRPKGKATTTRVKKVPEDDILDVLSADRSSTKHGETSLHKVD